MRLSQLWSRSVSLLVLCCALLLVNGCAAFYGLKHDPKISIADIRVQNIKAMEGVLLIKLRILNPNDVPLALQGIQCDMEINQRHFASVLSNSNQTIPAFGSAVVPIEVYASLLDILASVTDLLHSVGKTPGNDTPTPYTLRGSVRVDIRGFTREVPFNTSGEVSLKGLTLPK